jgi:putative multiple sugar transport system ATP-binding protein
MARVGLREDPDTAIKNIGVGKQQLVEIAKALGKDVRLLILDEPTAALNEEDSAHLLDLMRGLRAKGITAIMISHKLNEIRAIADAITIIRDGQSIETLRVDAGWTRTVSFAAWSAAPWGRASRSTPRTSARPSSRSGTGRVRHPQIPERLVCKDSRFFVRRGEIVGFAGLMGAGRTELMPAPCSAIPTASTRAGKSSRTARNCASHRRRRHRRRHRLCHRGPQECSA